MKYDWPQVGHVEAEGWEYMELYCTSVPHRWIHLKFSIIKSLKFSIIES